MAHSTKSHFSKEPPIYRQLGIDIAGVDEEATEIGLIRTLLAAHIAKVTSGNIGTDGRQGLLKILNDLEEVERFLKEQ
jgi:hypothetical protein